MKRVIALVFVVGLFAATVFAPAAIAKGSGPGHGHPTAGSCTAPGLAFGANEKCR